MFLSDIKQESPCGGLRGRLGRLSRLQRHYEWTPLCDVCSWLCIFPTTALLACTQIQTQVCFSLSKQSLSQAFENPSCNAERFKFSGLTEAIQTNSRTSSRLGDHMVKQTWCWGLLWSRRCRATKNKLVYGVVLSKVGAESKSKLPNPFNRPHGSILVTLPPSLPLLSAALWTFFDVRILTARKVCLLVKRASGTNCPTRFVFFKLAAGNFILVSHQCQVWYQCQRNQTTLMRW